MNGLKNIIKAIDDNTRSKIQEILEDTRKKVLDIKAEAKTKILKEQESTLLSGRDEISLFFKKNKLNLEDKKKKEILLFKNKSISDIISAAKAYIKNLPDDEYFSFILKMIEKFSFRKSGEVIFSRHDFQRLPEGFEEKINLLFNGKFKLKISSNSLEKINLGFVLVYGKVEENCSIDSIFRSNFEKFSDLVSKVLFDVDAASK